MTHPVFVGRVQAVTMINFIPRYDNNESNTGHILFVTSGSV